MTKAIWWIRRDLRLHDNQALGAALKQGGTVLPVFILDNALLTSEYVGEKRLGFLFACLRELDRELKSRGSRLIVRRGDPKTELTKFGSEIDLQGIYAEEDFSPYARRRDQAIANSLPLHLQPGLTVFPVDLIEKKAGGPYTVYTPYRKAWESLLHPSRGSLIPAPSSMGSAPEIKGQPLPDSPKWKGADYFPPGERAARQRLEAFTSGEDAPIYRYDDQRDRVDLEGTSRLSPYLRFGMISIREAVIHAIEARRSAPHTKARAGAQTWLQELIWREFFINILYHYPFVREVSFREDYRQLQWRNNEHEFEAWCTGRTGYPIVDAAMRQLLETGWMHNRARMVVASFLVKDLLIDWRWGERWFMQHLVDGDPAPNNGGWQWSAGTGTDAAPYFRIFNPTMQSQKHDSHAVYIRRWIPELSSLPDGYIHRPWETPPEVQDRVNVNIGEDYPLPIVTHSIARERALDSYARARAK